MTRERFNKILSQNEILGQNSDLVSQNNEIAEKLLSQSLDNVLQ